MAAYSLHYIPVPILLQLDSRPRASYNIALADGLERDMPTPLVHIYISQRILNGLAGPAAQVLHPHAGDFALGSLAPDAWWAAGISRQEAHILPIPVPAERHGAAEYLARYPALADAAALPPEQQAFVAGYLTHLRADEIWFRDVYDPYFGPGSSAGRRLGLLLHNVLRVHLERELDGEIGQDLVEALCEASPCYDVPPFGEVHLRTLRDMICAELRPGAERRSVEVFADRLGVAPQELLDILSSPDRLRHEVLDRLPAGILERVLDESRDEGRALAVAYLAGRGAST
jgi:hypothetical protein